MGIQNLVSPVHLLLKCLAWRHHQAAIKNCCHLAALQGLIWYGRWKTSFSMARLTLGVMAAFLEVGGCATFPQHNAPLSLSSLSPLLIKGVLAGKMVEGK